jgi:VanZ family protein
LTRTRAVDLALWSGVAVVAVGIVVISVTADPNIKGMQFAGADKVGHAIAYFALTLMLLLAGVWRPGRSSAVWRGPAPALLLAVAYGGVLELIQGAVGRDAQFPDLLADALGALLALALWSVMRRAWGGEPTARAPGGIES